jgi:Ni/Fe-hydrogenase subunit HybB-like protein
MFEVAWCVMLYTTVLALESSLFVFERLRLSKFYSLVKSVTFVLVVIGVILSTLHQSSLGSLFLIVPAKLSPLWYTPLLPLLFYISAIAAGIAMVIVESHLSHRAFDRELESGLTVKLARISAWVLVVYFALKMTEIVRQGAFPLIFRLNYPSLLFLLEVGVGIALPLIIFAVPRLRSSKNGLFLYGLSVVSGLVINRLNVSITGFESLNGRRYAPSWQELAVSVALVATGVFIFYTASRFLPIFPRRKFTVESATNT